MTGKFSAIDYNCFDASMFMCECHRGNGEVIGMLKMGRKRLFLFDEHGEVREVEPMCVLDFYIKRDRQRLGLGYRLFNYMLNVRNATSTPYSRFRYELH